jgi:uncharacterized protein
MLAFDLRTLAATAATVDGVLATADPIWQPQDRLPVDGVRVTGRLSAAGPGRFYLSGQISGVLRDECRRCLTAVETPVSARVQCLFAESGVDDADDDPDVYLYDPRAWELDVRQAVREQWLLSAPEFSQCREDCAGLCPSCGADLNAEPCGCPARVDDRWAVLRDVGSLGGAPGGPPDTT